MRRALCALLVVMPASCTVIQTEFAGSLDSVDASFEVGETTLEDVVAALGPPTAMGAFPEGSAILYECARVRELQIGLGVSEYLKLALGRGIGKREEVAFTFDRAGRLTAQAFSRRTENLGTGGSVQIAIAVQSVVDTKAISEELAPHEWGTGLLVPLDEGLNRNSDLHTGRAGVEQVGTPTGVGQHCLEWANR